MVDPVAPMPVPVSMSVRFTLTVPAEQRDLVPRYEGEIARIAEDHDVAAQYRTETARCPGAPTVFTGDFVTVDRPQSLRDALAAVTELQRSIDALTPGSGASRS